MFADIAIVVFTVVLMVVVVCSSGVVITAVIVVKRQISQAEKMIRPIPPRGDGHDMAIQLDGQVWFRTAW